MTSDPAAIPPVMSTLMKPPHVIPFSVHDTTASSSCKGKRRAVTPVNPLAAFDTKRPRNGRFLQQYSTPCLEKEPVESP
jgi:hypothetical protein